MSAGLRYGLGLLVVLAGTAGIAIFLSGEDRSGLLTALGITVIVQVPLGWWLIRSVGRPIVLAAWVVGMLVRLGVVALVGLVLVPWLRWPAGPTLIALAALILALLLVESAVLWFEHFGSEA